MKNTTWILLGGIVSGALLGAALYAWLSPQSAKEGAPAGEPKPLYWVAPMDPNYRRDQPGKSPMGMDLVPVFEQAESARSGEVRISPAVENNMGVRTASAELRSLQTEIHTVGYLRFDEDRLIHIHPRVAGWVESLYVDTIGDPVVGGEPLYALYSPELVNAQEELVLALRRGNEQFVQASIERMRALHFSQDFIDNLRRTRKIQQTVTFPVPQSGVVGNLEIREGFYVEPDTTMLSIGALDPIWVEGEVFAGQAALVAVGDPVTMSLDYFPGQTWQGTVAYIYPTLDAQNRTARVRLTFANPDGKLKPNMFAQLVIHARSAGEVLAVPRAAVIRTGRQNRVVLALGEGKFKSIEVQTGRATDAFVEIKAGLEAGERVVTSAQFLLDSESSKTSDFTRMQADSGSADEVWVAGELLAILDEGRRLRVRHAPIPQWQWPAMSMAFDLADGVTPPRQSGGDFRFRIQKRGANDFWITALEQSSPAAKGDDPTPSGAREAGMDHSQMDHSQMDHSQMDHSGMDHSEMDHSEMDQSGMDHTQMEPAPMRPSGSDHAEPDHSRMEHAPTDHSQMDHGNAKQGSSP